MERKGDPFAVEIALGVISPKATPMGELGQSANLPAYADPSLFDRQAEDRLIYVTKTL